jgi:hypothetical protein
MKVDNHYTDAVFLRPKNDSITGAPRIVQGEEDFASLVEKSGQDLVKNLSATEVITGTSSDKSGSAAFLSQSSLAQLQLARLQLSSQAQESPKEASEKIEEALSLLEEYAVALGDPANTLKDLAPMAEELSLSADSLNILSQGLAQGDPLKELGTETATLSKVEALKFMRGDFV